MYDVICIGGGLNYSAGIVLAKSDLKVVLIEKKLEHLGGTCLHNGCIPSKNLLHRAKVILESTEDIFTQKAKLNLKKLHQKVVTKLELNTKSITTQCKMAGLEIIEGDAFVTDNGVEVNGKLLTSKYIIIGTGSRPNIPKNIEYDKKHIITSDEALEFEHIPKEITVYGTGAIGLEMASLFASLGSKVNLMYRHDTISKKFPVKITEKLEEQLKNIGINLIPNSNLLKAVTKDNKVIMDINNKKITTEYLLVATGRILNTEVVKTDKIKIDRSVEVDDYFQTSMKNVFAIGDVNHKLLLAHSARAQALNVTNQILGRKEKLNIDNIPKFIYTLPLSYANIGITTDNITSFKISNLGISGSSLGDELGLIMIYTDDEQFIVGADILAPNAEELIGIISTALAGEMDINSLKKAVFPHPTYSEIIDRVVKRVR